MTGLDDKILAQLRKVSRLGFHMRWQAYWPIVFSVIENDPASSAEVRDAIVEFEEYTAKEENRPTLDRLLGDQRRLWQEETEAVFAEFIEPFINASGTAEERELLYQELQQVRADVKQKVANTERSKAYPEYVLALDYATAFANVARLAFTKIGTRPPSRSRVAAPPPPPAQPAPRPAPSSDAAPQPLEPLSVDPRSDDFPVDEPVADRTQRRARRSAPVTMIVLVFLVILLGTGGGLVWLLKPELISTDRLTGLFGSSETARLEQRVDSFIATDHAACSEPPTPTTWQQIKTYADCVYAAIDRVDQEFGEIVDMAGGTWNGDAEAEVVESVADETARAHLQRAWVHFQSARGALNDAATQSVLAFEGEFYPPDDQRNAIGWRFAIWLCRCNEKAEAVDEGADGAANRAFISSPELVTTPLTYTNLVARLRDYFLGGTRLGDPTLVATTVEQFDLPYGFEAGPRLGGPFSSRTETAEAIETLKRIYGSAGFEVTEFSLR